MNKNFNLHRLLMVLRWDILTNWKGYFNRTIGLAIGLLVICLLFLHKLGASIASGGLPADLDTAGFFQDEISACVMTVAAMLFFITASNIFGNMRTKLQRESFLMLPANNLEKYIARFLMMTVGGFVMFVIAVLLADFVQFIFSFLLCPGHHASIAWVTLKELFDSHQVIANAITGQTELELSMIVWSFVILLHSFCIFGGALFRKHPILFTAGLGILLFLIVGYVGEGTHDLNLFETVDFSEGTVAHHVACISTITFFLALSAALYWASYKIFTRMQVVCNKWINL